MDFLDQALCDDLLGVTDLRDAIMAPPYKEMLEVSLR